MRTSLTIHGYAENRFLCYPHDNEGDGRLSSRTGKENMTERYTPERKQAIEKRARAAAAGAAILGAAALAGSIALCFGVRMGNAMQRLTLCVLLCALAGTAALIAAEYVILPGRRLARHMERILSQPAGEHTGRVVRVGGAVRIPHSISFAPVETEEDGTVRQWKAVLPLVPLPGEGSTVRFTERGGYITGLEGTGKPAKASGGVRRALRVCTRAVLCLLGCTVLWGFVFSHLTGAPAEQKVTLYIHSVRVDTWGLSAVLEQDLPQGVRMVQARPFTYAMMDQEGLEKADLYVVSEEDVNTYIDWFAPLPQEWADREGCFVDQGVPMGVPADGAAGQYVTYLSPEGNGGAFYLFFGKNSAHDPQTGDPAALLTAEAFLRMER